MDFQQKLEEYAELVVKVGLNIQPNQPLLINTTTDTIDFTRLIVKKAYEAGAKRVDVNYTDEVNARAFYDYAPDEAFNEFPKWAAMQRDELIENKGALLWIDADNPDLLEGVSIDRISSFQKASGKALENYRKAVMNDVITWSIVAMPSEKWAAKVFPNLKPEEQMQALWELIFQVVRIGEGTAVQRWKEHIGNLESRATLLNNKRFKKLHYKAEGTDIQVELPKEHIWMSGASKNGQNVPFIANMPTEEVYTAPLKTGVNGYVKNTKPFVYQGNVIDDFTLTFENGKITSIKAAAGEKLLQELIGTDEGAKYLGEIALVPHESPISASNVLFFNTLFDENASNHFAIGEAYPTCVEGARGLTQSELEQMGINTSIVHEDFMIGSGDMDIMGELADGTMEPIFIKGAWAF
ncbi:aminopeptidase [Psychrobacillus psychrodurans]|uniref:Aminopeptidase n=1 Tax=Psychrobacillus psychrodurans TaxID=126157 RepID=A0A9X3LA02_9BACI|nr:aminopeptidase [Psychrobacillus psychrodurans]MCZ8534112.1 aminopeptidase [Psychrobacillus psychrodurans]